MSQREKPRVYAISALARGVRRGAAKGENVDTKIEEGKPLELEIEIEELEVRQAPDGGETVLPLAPVRPHH